MRGDERAGPPFAFRRRRRDALWRLGGFLERAGRAALRRLRRGGPLIESGDLGRLRPRPPVPAPGPVPGGPPLVLLPAVAWSYRFQRPQQLARAALGQGHPVLYVEAFDRSRLQPPLRSEPHPGGLLVLGLRVPGRPDPYRSRLGREPAGRLAAAIAGGLEEEPLAVLAQLPFWGELGRELRRRLAVPLVYDRCDLHTGFPGVPAAVGEAEDELLRQADLILASSRELEGRPRELGRRAVRVPNAVALEDFHLAARPPEGPPAVGYAGALGEWFDAGAVAAAAREQPGWSFLLAGRVESRGVAELGRLPNVRLLGEVPYREVPAFLAGLGAVLVPFRESALTRAVDPVKLYEGLAVGLPMVARRLPETERWPEPAVYLYRTAGELGAGLARALAEDGPERRRRRRELVAAETWGRRAAAIVGEIRTLGRGRQGGGC